MRPNNNEREDRKSRTFIQSMFDRAAQQAINRAAQNATQPGASSQAQIPWLQYINKAFSETEHKINSPFTVNSTPDLSPTTNQTIQAMLDNNRNNPLWGDYAKLIKESLLAWGRQRPMDVSQARKLGADISALDGTDAVGRTTRAQTQWDRDARASGLYDSEKNLNEQGVTLMSDKYIQEWLDKLAKEREGRQTATADELQYMRDTFGIQDDAEAQRLWNLAVYNTPAFTEEINKNNWYTGIEMKDYVSNIIGMYDRNNPAVDKGAVDLNKARTSLLEGEQQRRAQEGLFAEAMEDPDFAVRSQYIDTYNGNYDERFQVRYNFFGAMPDAYREDDVYHYINNPEFRARYDNQALNTGAGNLQIGGNSSDLGMQGYAWLDDDQRKYFNSLWNDDGNPAAHEEAMAFLKSIEPSLLARRAKNQEEVLREVTQEAPAVGYVTAAGANLINAALGPTTMVATATGMADENNPLFDSVRATNIPRQELGQSAYDWGYENWGEFGGILTQGAFNLSNVIVDQIALRTIGGIKNLGKTVNPNVAKTLATALQGSQMATTTIQQELSEGASNEGALLKGALAWGISAFVENNSLDAFMSNPTSGVKYALQNLISEGVEEGEENVLNTLASEITRLFTGDTSKLGKIYDAAIMETGGDYKAAVELVVGNYLKELSGDVLLGALAGGVMGAPGAVEIAAANTQTGQRVQENDYTDRLMQLAETMPEDSESRKLWESYTRKKPPKAVTKVETKQAPAVEAPTETAQNAPQEAVVEEVAKDTQTAAAAPEIKNEPARKGKKLSAAKIGRLYRTLYNDLDAQGKQTVAGVMESSVKGRLAELGEDQASIDEVAAPLAKLLADGTLTNREKQIIARSKNALRVFNEIRFAEDDTYSSDWVGEADKAAAEANADNTDTRAELASMLAPKVGKRVVETAQRTVAESGMAVANAKHGTDAKLGVQLTGEDGQTQEAEILQVTGVTKAGMKVKVKGSDGQTKTVDMADMKFANSDTATIAAYIQKAPHVFTAEEANKMMQTYMGGDVQEHISGFTTLYNAGYAGRAIPPSKLPQAQVIYDLGKQDAATDEANRLKGIGTGKRGTGKVTFAPGVQRAGLNKVQRISEYVLRILGKAAGIDFVLYESAADTDGYYRDANGRYQNNTLYIDMNSGKNSTTDTTEYAILRTAAHEITHYIEQNSAEGYAKLKDYVKSEYARKGKSWDNLVEAKLNTRTMNSRLTRTGAEAEVMADAMEMMLQDSKAIERLQHRDQSLYEKIKRFVVDYFRKVREAFANVGATHNEAKWLMEEGADGVMHYTERMVQLWDEALVEAVEAVQGKTEASDSALATAETVQLSVRDDEYIAAVNAGDMQKAQRLVNEAAEIALHDSKVRGKNGKLLKVFHGTKAEFTVFDTSKQGGVNGTNEGYGIYLYDSQDVTSAYGDRQISAFANIKKPATSWKKTVTLPKLSKLIKDTCEAEAKRMVADGDYDSVKDAVKDTWVRNYTDTYSTPSMESAYRMVASDILRMNDNDMAIVQEVMAGMAIRDYASAEAFYKEFLTPVTGIDGFWTKWTNHSTGEYNNIILAMESSQIKSADPVTYDDDGNIIPLDERFDADDPDIRYSLREVAPVEPRKRDVNGQYLWMPGHSESWFRENGFPIYEDVPLEQQNINRNTDTKGHGTQIASTVSTYEKLFTRLKKEHPEDWQNLRVLDASSGLGLGTKAGREMGFNVTDIEPFPAKNYHPDYTDYSKLQDMVASGEVEGYDYIISNAVLNVIPQNTRDNLVAAMGSLLKPGGQMFINVISKTYDGAVKSSPDLKNSLATRKGSARTMEGDYSAKGNVYGRGHETFVWGSNSVQKVFSYNELTAYLEDALGDGYTVKRDSLGMTGVTVTKDAVEDVQFSPRIVNGQKVVWVDNNILDEKPADQSDASYIKEYLVNHIDDVYTIIESGSKVYPAKKLPDEYLYSKFSQSLAKYNRSKYHAKLRFVPGIGEMVEIATNRRWEKTKHTHNKNAKYGIYRYDTRIAFQGGNGPKAYMAELIILNADDGRKYLYDVVGIKKDDVTANGLMVKARGAINYAQQTNNVNNSISETYAVDNPSSEENFQESRREVTHHSLAYSYMETMQPTTSMNESERWLLDKYQRTVKELREKQAAYNEQRNLAVNGTSAEERAKAKNRANLLDKQMGQLREILRKAERAEGFATLMNTAQKVAERFMTDENSLLAADASDRLDNELADVQAQLKAITKQLANAEAGQRTAFAKGLFNAKALNEAGQTIRKAFNTRVSGKEISNRLALVYAELYAENNPERFAIAMRALAQDVLESSKSRYRSPVLADLKDTIGSISLSEAQKQELAKNGVTISDFKRVVNPVVQVTDGGADLGTIVSSAEYYGTGIISQLSSADSEGDMIMTLYNTIRDERAKESEAAMEGMTHEESIGYAMAEIMNTANFPMAESGANLDAMRNALTEGIEENQAIAAQVDKALATAKRASASAGNLWRKAAEINSAGKQAVEYYRAIDEQRRLLEQEELVRQLKSEAAQELKKQRQDFHDRMDRDRRVRDMNMKAAQHRKHLAAQVKKLDGLIRHETDYKHVPEELKPLVEAFVGAFTEKGAGIVFDKKQADKLSRVYRKLLQTDGSMNQLGYLYDEDVMRRLDELNDLLEEELAVRSGKGMTMEERAANRLATMEDLAEIADSVYGMVKNANELFYGGKKAQFAAIGTEAMQAMEHRADYRRLKGKAGENVEAADNFMRAGNMTPVYFFDRLKNKVFKTLYGDMLAAQDEYAFRVAEARKFWQETKEKYHYDSWADDAALTMKTEKGKQLTLDKEDAMSVYATWKREHADELLPSYHLEDGGIVLEGNQMQDSDKKYLVAVRTTPTTLTQNDMAQIHAYLTEEQKAYADAVVEYMSTTMADYGNETSMELYGIKKYKESYYFPMKSAGDQLYQKSTSGGGQVTDDNRVKHSSFTIARVRGAATPVVIGKFSQVAATHMEQMILYSTMTMPIESMNRVLNYKHQFEDGSKTTVRAMMEQKYGPVMKKYMETFLSDMNGGIRRDSREAGLNKLVSLFKRGSVLASASVVVQQPTTIARATAMISPKYLMATTVPHKGDYDQLKKHSGVAILKDMGKFDVDMGAATAEWMLDADEGSYSMWQKLRQATNIKDFEAFKKRWNTIFTWAPGKADQMTWAWLWRAVKAEQAELNPGMSTGSDSFLDMCGERFNDIVNHTQVYDSTLVRSQNMRSKSGMMQMLTSFMSEPTLTANMLYDAVSNKERGKKYAVRAVTAALVSQILTSLAQALVSAGRDEDEKKTWAEKYAGKAAGNLASNLNPMNMLPLLRDIQSLMDGYDVTRADMSIFTEIYKAFGKLDNDNISPYRKAEELVGSLSKLLGIPAKNIMRDLRSFMTTFLGNADRPTMGYAVGEAVKAELLPGYDTKADAYYQKLYNAMAKGDRKEAETIREYLVTVLGKKETSVRTGIQTALKQEVLEGDVEKDEAIKWLMDNGLKNKQSEAFKTVDEWLDKAAHEDEEGYSYSMYGDFLDNIPTGGKAMVNAAKELLANGVDKKTIAKQIAERYKEQLIELHKKGNAATLLSRLLSAYEAIGYDRDYELKYIKKNWLGIK